VLAQSLKQLASILALMPALIPAQTAGSNSWFGRRCGSDADWDGCADANTGPERADELPPPFIFKPRMGLREYVIIDQLNAHHTGARLLGVSSGRPRTAVAFDHSSV
jgi:hypothetical protein